jgi:hypothetical protein
MDGMTYYKICKCGRPTEWMMLVNCITCPICHRYSYEVDLQCFRGEGILIVGDEKSLT